MFMEGVFLVNFEFGTANQRVQEMVDKVIDHFEELDIDGTHQELKDDLINAMVNRDMIKIVLVGQYSAGKSSIIKMLTGEDDIRIAADIATDKATSYQWKGVEITDTPGIDTRLRPEHDEISKRAIQEADMLLFVITNELFDENIAKDFKELAFTQNRKNAMLLVVNKMERANDGNSPEQQEIIKQDVARVTAPCTPDDFHIGFIDAKCYLDSLTENDEESRQYDRKESGYDAFTKQLDNFAHEKGLVAQLARPLHQCQSVLQELDDSYADVMNADFDGMQDAVEDTTMALDDFRSQAKSKIGELNKTIVYAGKEIAGQVQYGYDSEAVREQSEDVNKGLVEMMNTCADEIQSIMNQVNTSYQVNLPALRQDQLIKEASSDALPTKNLTIEPNHTFSKTYTQGSQVIQEGLQTLVKTAAKNADTAGKAFQNQGMFSRIFNTTGYQVAKSNYMSAASRASTLQTLSDIAGPLLAAGAVYAQYRDNQEKQKAERELYQIREGIQRKYRELAKEVSARMENGVEVLCKQYEGQLQAGKSDLERAVQKKDQAADNKALIRQYLDEINELIDSLQEAR